MNDNDKTIQDLRMRVQQLESKLERIDRQTIKIVGDYQSTTVPVTINGIRRKITHSAP